MFSIFERSINIRVSNTIVTSTIVYEARKIPAVERLICFRPLW